LPTALRMILWTSKFSARRRLFAILTQLPIQASSDRQDLWFTT
jgi:hypothetical protein